MCVPKVNVIIDNEKYDFDKGITLKEIANKYHTGDIPIVCAYVDNDLCSLDFSLNKDCSIKFLTYLDPIGNRVYLKGLMFLLVYAFKELCGYNNVITLCHPIDKAIMVRTSCFLSKNNLEKLKDKMKEIVNDDLRIKKCLVTRRDAKDYFESINFNSRAEVFKYNTAQYVELYKLGDLYDYFYSSVMPYSTGILDKFDFNYLDGRSFVFRFPTVDFNGEIPPYVELDKILRTFDNIYKLLTRMGVFTISGFNKRIAEGKANDIIKLTEAVSSGNLLGLAKAIDDNRDKIRLVLLAGPTSSGKTTTSRKLAMYLKVFGLNPKYLSIDDYFLNRADTPKLENGEYDFESINAINVNLFNEHLAKLMNGEEVAIPTFNFYKGESEYLGKTLKLEDEDILIIEGLHAINEELTNTVPKESKYKVYVSPLSDLNIDDHNMISNSDIRLLRRIVRDNRVRGYGAEDTIKSWQAVRAAETKNIFPYQEEADAMFNSSLVYELAVFKDYAIPLLEEIGPEEPEYSEARRLITLLKYFESMNGDLIPNNSLIKEFIGGSIFE